MIHISDKNRLNDCLSSLKEIEQQLVNLSFTDRQSVLSLCQQMAVEMGNLIEERLGEGTAIVSLLEQYCEEIYQLSLEDEGICPQDQIGILLQQIEETVISLDTRPVEVLFLPYKASMWDCMETVYHAARQQEGCRVVVMPIPYYNVNPQGDILSVEYEGKHFPDNVEITDFRYYDLKQIQPDVIFIHNPYDEYNYVTRVAPDYFSKELVKYTKRLVYIPYFVTSKNEVASHYCVVPGVKYAWRTFVQSEKVREGYIRYMGRPDSIVALGSPKFDGVKAVEKNLSRIPEEWKVVIGQKKVFLLNSHILGIINQAEVMLEKLEGIFAFFANRRDIVLLWRPHPLSMETARSLNPEFTHRYLSLVKGFKERNIGIYDESSDIHRAIAIADGYIGNFSSVVSLYGVSGKPLFIVSYGLNNLIDSGEELLQEELEQKMRGASGFNKYIYHESYISMESFIDRVIREEDLCVEERKNSFFSLQYGYTQEETSGERIWKYVYQKIIDEN